MKAILFLTSCQCGHLNKVGSQATWTVAVSSGEVDRSPAPGTEKGLRADRDLSSPLPRPAMEVSPDTRGGRGVQLLLLLRLLVVTAAGQCARLVRSRLSLERRAGRHVGPSAPRGERNVPKEVTVYFGDHNKM